MANGSRETSSAVSAASRVARERRRARRDGMGPADVPRRRRGKGSLVLTALTVVAALIAVLVLMMKLSG